MSRSHILSASILTLGLLGAGFSLSHGIRMIKDSNRTLSVKGLAERAVVSDLGIWEMNYREVGNDLIQINQKLSQDKIACEKFLKSQGFTSEEMIPMSLKIDDRLANIYDNSNTSEKKLRFVVTTGIRVRTNKVQQLKIAAENASALMQQGIPLAFDAAQIPNPSYYFTGLDAIRPEMLSNAIQSARQVAGQFEKDAGVEITGVQKANQGIFQIISADASSASNDDGNQNALSNINKRVRLVTTIEYSIKNKTP